MKNKLDIVCRIEMTKDMESLNVSAAAAIAMNQIFIKNKLTDFLFAIILLFAGVAQCQSSRLVIGRSGVRLPSPALSEKLSNYNKIYSWNNYCSSVIYGIFWILRPSILYDYLDYWPLIIFPLVVLIGTRNTEYKEKIIVYSYSFLIAVSLFFHMAHLLEANFLTTYSYDSDFENLNLDENFEYQLYIDENNSIELVSFLGNGYKVDIIDKPGKSGYPEAVETLLGDPRAVIFRQIETSTLLKVKGWAIELGSDNLGS